MPRPFLIASVSHLVDCLIDFGITSAIVAISSGHPVVREVLSVHAPSRLSLKVC